MQPAGRPHSCHETRHRSGATAAQHVPARYGRIPRPLPHGSAVHRTAPSPCPPCPAEALGLSSAPSPSSAHPVILSPSVHFIFLPSSTTTIPFFFLSAVLTAFHTRTLIFPSFIHPPSPFSSSISSFTLLFFQPIFPPTYPPTLPLFFHPSFHPTHLSLHPPFHPCYQPTPPSTQSAFHFESSFPIILSITCPSICPSLVLSFLHLPTHHRLFCLSIHSPISFLPSIHLSIYLSVPQRSTPQMPTDILPSTHCSCHPSCHPPASSPSPPDPQLSPSLPLSSLPQPTGSSIPI